jgi:hypothetical protein
LKGREAIEGWVERRWLLTPFEAIREPSSTLRILFRILPKLGREDGREERVREKR